MSITCLRQYWIAISEFGIQAVSMPSGARDFAQRVASDSLGSTIKARICILLNRNSMEKWNHLQGWDFCLCACDNSAVLLTERPYPARHSLSRTARFR